MNASLAPAAQPSARFLVIHDTLPTASSLVLRAPRSCRLGRATSLASPARAEVTGPAPPGGGSSGSAVCDASADTSLDQLRQQSLERRCFVPREPACGLAHEGIASGSRSARSAPAASGQSHLHP